jgi:methylmalonyl-CoA mutase N-terminal domain/subunit
MDFFEEIAKVRAARRMWSEIAVSRYGAKDPNSARLRFFSGCSGATLTAQQPLNNVVRSTLQCLAAVLGGAQSIHVMGFDEALEIPTEESVRLALRTQQIIALESGVTSTVDPLAGSFFVESLTDSVQAAASEILARIQDGGGAAALIEQGELQRWIAENAFQIARDTASGARPKVGVNVFHDDQEEPAAGLFEPDASAGDRQVARLAAHRRARDDAAVTSALHDLARDVVAGGNVMPPILVAARCGATVGEISDVLRQEYGDYREPSPW